MRIKRLEREQARRASRATSAQRANYDVERKQLEKKLRRAELGAERQKADER